MAVTILYFAWLRERIGVDQEARDLPATVTTPAALIEWLIAQGDGYREAFADLTRIRCAIDQQMASLDGQIAGAREIAFFPPVTGG